MFSLRQVLELRNLGRTLNANTSPMRDWMRATLGFALVCSFVNIANANEIPPPACNQQFRNLLRQGTTSLTVENDLFAKSDRQYTSGIKIGLVTPDIPVEEREKCLNKWALGFNKFLLQFANTEKAPITLSLTLVGQDMYTPEYRYTNELIKKDRPYAGWLYMGYGVNARVDEEHSSVSKLHSVELQIGVVGPAARGKEAQDFIHRIIDAEYFQGWNNQLKNEPAFLYHYEFKYKPQAVFPITAFGPEWGWSMIHHGGVSLGTVSSYVNAGSAIRFGRNIPDDFGTSPIRPGGNNSAPHAVPPGAENRDAVPQGKRLGRKGFSAHLYLSLDARVVANNIFLDGNTFRSSHSVGPRRLVADAAFGAVMIGKCWKLAAGRVVRTKEFDLQPHVQKYGSITVSFEDGYFDSLLGIGARCNGA